MTIPVPPELRYTHYPNPVTALEKTERRIAELEELLAEATKLAEKWKREFERVEEVVRVAFNFHAPEDCYIDDDW